MKTYLGNNKDVLKTFESNSIDSIVTDPPYELGFMGKSWDSSGIAYDVELWSELLRVLKPGGHLLAFSGTRTYHRMAVAIEDAGFEIRDMIEWVYGSGFPKSLNIGKAVDKLQGNEREEISRGGKCGVFAHSGSGIEQNIDNYEAVVTKGTSQYEGWGTALKPAHEPICMARKPLSEKTVAENCLKWGTGGINIDESRVGTEVIKNNQDKKSLQKFKEQDGRKHKEVENPEPTYNLGRFPANLIHDGSEEVMACFPETKSGSGVKNPKNGAVSSFRASVQNDGYYSEGDQGNASRFFKSIIYTSKPSKAERNLGCEPVFNLFEQSEGLEDKESPKFSGGEETREGKPSLRPKLKNFHPTVKPIELMEYLIKMVTPKGGIVLDPFMGSGSTGCGAVKNGFDFIGIDMTPEYLEIAEKRIKRYLPL